jgi:hypothetical protein
MHPSCHVILPSNVRNPAHALAQFAHETVVWNLSIELEFAGLGTRDGRSRPFWHAIARSRRVVRGRTVGLANAVTERNLFRDC